MPRGCNHRGKDFRGSGKTSLGTDADPHSDAYTPAYGDACAYGDASTHDEAASHADADAHRDAYTPTDGDACAHGDAGSAGYSYACAHGCGIGRVFRRSCH